MDILLPFRCPMDGKCRLEKEIIKERLSKKPYAFVALPSASTYDATEAAIKAVVEGGHVFNEKFRPKSVNDKKIKVVLARTERFVGQGICKICQLSWFSDFGIVELGDLNANVMIETGLLMGFGKRIIFALNTSRTSIKRIPFDLGNPMLIPYNNVIHLSSDLEDKVNFLILTWPR